MVDPGHGVVGAGRHERGWTTVARSTTTSRHVADDLPPLTTVPATAAPVAPTVADGLAVRTGSPARKYDTSTQQKCVNEVAHCSIAHQGIRAASTTTAVFVPFDMIMLILAMLTRRRTQRRSHVT
jgi:hypothetical protein